MEVYEVDNLMPVTNAVVASAKVGFMEHCEKLAKI